MTAITVRRPPGSIALPDNGQWTNRFEIKSSTSNQKYVIAQHKTGRYWKCGCNGCIRWGHCHHLQAIGLPGDFQPFEAQLGK